MINIKILCVGALKETYFVDMADEYIKRIGKYAKLEIIELKDEAFKTQSNLTNLQNIKDKECKKILDKIDNMSNTYIFVLDETGKMYSSAELAEKIQKVPVKGYSTIVFVIGGSLGLNNEIRTKANEIISFSRQTFPHQMIRVFLLEQIFRCFKIINNENYHY
jgi:23S rRNA (pseudouridine1915-N3)-methyltransferase